MARIPRTATLVISALTALAWLIVVILGADDWAARTMGFIPARLSGAQVPWAAVPAWLTPLSATLVHSGPIHIGFNLLLFAWCGTAVERVLGRGPLFLIYVIGAYAAAAGQWLSDPHGMVPMIGASGAISAVIGAFALSFGRAKLITKSARVNRWINIVWLLVAWVVLQVLVGWTAGAQGYLLATPAHIGGFLAGLLMQRPLLLWKFRSA
ncbi:MAG TPA: rhomboid family intramembrane serine protease [Sphingomicrobium sp.]|nr:rhomboid family intramembrane serine protease [Sphingomicrobium sp.]